MSNLEPYRNEPVEEKALGPTVGGGGPRNMDPMTAVDADLDRIVLEGIPTVNLGRGVPDPTPFGSDSANVRRVLRRISGGRYGRDTPNKPADAANEVVRSPEETGRGQRRFRNLAERLKKPRQTQDPTASMSTDNAARDPFHMDNPDGYFAIGQYGPMWKDIEFAALNVAPESERSSAPASFDQYLHAEWTEFYWDAVRDSTGVWNVPPPEEMKIERAIYDALKAETIRVGGYGVPFPTNPQPSDYAEEDMGWLKYRRRYLKPGSRIPLQDPTPENPTTWRDGDLLYHATATGLLPLIGKTGLIGVTERPLWFATSPSVWNEQFPHRRDVFQNAGAPGMSLLRVKPTSDMNKKLLRVADLMNQSTDPYNLGGVLMDFDGNLLPRGTQDLEQIDVAGGYAMYFTDAVVPTQNIEMLNQLGEWVPLDEANFSYINFDGKTDEVQASMSVGKKIRKMMDDFIKGRDRRENDEASRAPEPQPTVSPSSPLPKDTRRDSYGGDESIIADQADQLAEHEGMANAGDWNGIHGGHYDWWAYPIDRGSAAYGEFYNVAGEPLERLKQNKQFLDNVAAEIKLQAEALGWSLYESKFVDEPDWDGGQDWRKAYPTRIWKMTRSAQILGLEEEFESLKLMQQSLVEGGITFNHRKYWASPGTVDDIPPLDSAYDRSSFPSASTDPYPSLFDPRAYDIPDTRRTSLTPSEEERIWDAYDSYEVPTDPVLRAADELAMLLGETVEDDDLSYPYLDMRRDDRLDIADLISFAGTLLPASQGDGLDVDRSETSYALAKVLQENNFYEDDVSTIETLIEVLNDPSLIEDDFLLDDPTASMSSDDKPKERRRFKFTRKTITPEEIDLVRRYEGNEIRQSDLAKELGLTHMAISRRYVKARQKLDDNVYEALGFMTPSGIPKHLMPKRKFPYLEGPVKKPDAPKTYVRLSELDRDLIDSVDAGITIDAIAQALGVRKQEAARRVDVAFRRIGRKTPTQEREDLRTFLAEQVAMMRKRGIPKGAIMRKLGLSDPEYKRLLSLRRQEAMGWFPALTDDEYDVAEMYFVDLMPVDAIAYRISMPKQRGNYRPASLEAKERMVATLLNSAMRKLETGRTTFGDDKQSLTPNMRYDNTRGMPEKRAARINQFLSTGQLVRTSDMGIGRGRISRRLDRNSIPADPTAGMSSTDDEDFSSLQRLSDNPLSIMRPEIGENGRRKTIHSALTEGDSDNSLKDFLTGPFIDSAEYPLSISSSYPGFVRTAKEMGLGAYKVEGHGVPKVQGPVFYEFADRLVGRDIVDRAISTAYPTYDELLDVYAANALSMARLMLLSGSQDIQSIIGSILSGRPTYEGGNRLWTFEGETTGLSPNVVGVNALSLYDSPNRPLFMTLVIEALGLDGLDSERFTYSWPNEPIDFSGFSVDQSNPLAPFARKAIMDAEHFVVDYRDFASRWAKAAVETMTSDGGLNTEEIRKAIETHWKNSGFGVDGGPQSVLSSALKLANNGMVAGYAPIIHLMGPETVEIPLHEFFHVYIGQGFTRHGEYAAFRGPWEVYESWGGIFHDAINSNTAFWRNVMTEEMKRRGEESGQLALFIRRELSARVEKILQSADSNSKYARLLAEVIPEASGSNMAQVRSLVATVMEPWESQGWETDGPMPKAMRLLSVPGAMVPRWLWPFGNGSFGSLRRYIDPDTGIVMEYDPASQSFKPNTDRR